jgi:hypothetical protein
MGQTVNLLSFDFGGSNPSAPTLFAECLRKMLDLDVEADATGILLIVRDLLWGYAEIAQLIEH